MRKITPLIIGSGISGHAIARSLLTLSVTSPHLGIGQVEWVQRGSSLRTLKEKFENPLLFVANPHGLHAKTIIEADQAGFSSIVCEKPSCVNEREVALLREVNANVAILHIYRQMWGPQCLKTMLSEGAFGDLISIEGRYWQASTAERALSTQSELPAKSWKNDPLLSGEYDAFLDVGVHWVDLVSFLYGNVPGTVSGWKSYINSQTPHRDSHIQLILNFPNNGRAFTSISKTYHGARNHFEVNIIGSEKSATWTFMNPDEIIIGEGRDRRIVTRKDAQMGSRQPPHHGMGWLEGYIEICEQMIKESFYKEKGSYPRLKENLDMMDSLFKTRWE